jgi:hypothetical protein
MNRTGFKFGHPYDYFNTIIQTGRRGGKYPGTRLSIPDQGDLSEEEGYDIIYLIYTILV